MIQQHSTRPKLLSPVDPWTCQKLQFLPLCNLYTLLFLEHALEPPCSWPV